MGHTDAFIREATPLLYAEEQLLPLPPARLQGQLSGLVGELLAAGDAERRKSVVRCALEDLGFKWMAYGTITQQNGRAVPTRFFTSYAHAAWQRRYFAQRYHEVDSRHQDVPNSSLPLIWDLDGLGQGERLNGRQREFLDDFRDSGIKSGLFFRLTSPLRAHEHTVISLLSPRPGRSWIVDGVLGRALTLGLSVHEVLSHHLQLHEGTGSSMGEMAPISVTQRQILEELQRGRSDKEIAHRLQLTMHAVDYHMRQLRRRFAARNRVQLVNASVELRELRG